MTIMSDSSPGILFREATWETDSGITWLVDDMSFVTSSVDVVYASDEYLLRRGGTDFACLERRGENCVNCTLTSWSSYDSLGNPLL